MKMNAEKKIRKYIEKESNRGIFTYAVDIAEHTIWGFREATYKNFKRAINKVNSVIEIMEQEGSITVENDMIYMS